jgi:peptidoglycan/LPS O-acetylase OafA/YrhL
VANWFFLQNYFHDAKVFVILGHTWTLAVEEHFYLFLPAVLMTQIAVFPKRNPFRLIPVIFLFIAITCLAFRCLSLGAFPLAWTTHMRIDSLFAGVALGYLYNFRMESFRKMTGHYALVVAALCCIPAALVERDNRTLQTIGLTGLLVGLSFLVAWCVVRTPKTSAGRAISKCTAKVGFYSYSIYLWQTFVVAAFEYHPSLSAAKFWIYIATTIFVGIGMAHLVEVPYLALRERLFPPSQNVPHPSVPSAQRSTLPSVSAPA